MNSRILNADFYIRHGEILLRSYENLIGSELIGTKSDNTAGIIRIWDAPFAVVSHGKENDPIFNFGNKVALELFELEFDEFIKMQSRKSAEEVEQRERDRLLAEVTKRGYIKNYSGVRISATGKRFAIEKAVIWNLRDLKGKYRGQAAMFKDWKYL